MSTKHPEAKKARRAIVKSWTEGNEAPCLTLPQELMHIIEKYCAVSKIDITFLLNDKISSINSQINSANAQNADNSVVKLILINKINNISSWNELYVYLEILYESGYDSIIQYVNRKKGDVIYYFEPCEAMGMVKDIWNISFSDINEKTLVLNKKNHSTEQIQGGNKTKKEELCCSFM